MTAEPYRTYKRQSWEDKLRSLSDAELLQELTNTTRLKNLWDIVPIRQGPANTHYRDKLKLIEQIKEERGL